MAGNEEMKYYLSYVNTADHVLYENIMFSDFAGLEAYVISTYPEFTSYQIIVVREIK